MWRRMRTIKKLDSPVAGQKMILASLSFGNKIDSKSKRVKCEVTEVTDSLITVTANGQSYQFTQLDWDPVSIKPKHRLFPSNEYLDELFEIASIRSKICIAFNFTSEDRQDFTLEQLRNATKALGL